MKRHLFLLPLLIVLWSPIPAADGGGAHPLYLWRASRNGTVVHLLGSIHILPESFYPFPAVVLEVIEEAEVLVLEADPRNADAFLNEDLLERSLYRDGTTIADHVPPKLLDRVLQILEDSGMYREAAMMMRPWLLALTLEAAAYEGPGNGAEGADPALGMEMAVLSMLPDAEVVELEGIPFQLELFSGLPEKEQIAMLESAVDHSRDPAVLLAEAVEAWKAGDPQAMESVMADGDSSGRSRAFERRLITERNRGMAETIGAMEFEDGKDYLVIVGSGHFYGEEGLPALLREEGFLVEQVDSEGRPIS